MSFYKLEATHNVIPLGGKSGRAKKTYKWFCISYDVMLMRLQTELRCKGTVKVKEISQAEYVRATR